MASANALAPPPFSQPGNPGRASHRLSWSGPTTAQNYQPFSSYTESKKPFLEQYEHVSEPRKDVVANEQPPPVPIASKPVFAQATVPINYQLNNTDAPGEDAPIPVESTLVEQFSSTLAINSYPTSSASPAPPPLPARTTRAVRAASNPISNDFYQYSQQQPLQATQHLTVHQPRPYSTVSNQQLGSVSPASSYQSLTPSTSLHQTHSLPNYPLPPNQTQVGEPLQQTVTDSVVDDRKSSGTKRFFGNMLVTRVARATSQSVASTVQMPLYLSPWGDNNPIVMPNVRKRDIALVGLVHTGMGELLPSAVEVADYAVKYSASFVTEQAIDQGIEKVSGHKPHKVKRRAGLNTLELRIKHKLLGVDANVTLWQEREAANRMDCSKGWLCPYFYASGRTFTLARSKDFSVGQLLGPGLAADAAIVPTLLGSIQKEDAPIISLCPWEQNSAGVSPFRRMGIFIVGISPYRTASAWSQSRIPNECRLSFHLLTHVPAIVVPVVQGAPVAAWSPWTLSQMISGSGDYNAQNHYYELLKFFESVIDENLMTDESKLSWKTVLGNGICQMIEGIIEAKAICQSLAGTNKFDLERAGFVMFRY